MACKPIRIRLTIYYGVIDMACKPMRIRLTSYYGNKVFYLIFTGCVYHAFLYNEPVIKFLFNFHSNDWAYYVYYNLFNQYARSWNKEFALKNIFLAY